MLKTTVLAVATMCLLSMAAIAEPPLGAVAKHQALLDVGTDLRLMCVAAHPDDEDGATLAMYRKKYGYKTFAVLATRGEGGQNEIGPDLYEKLAVLRTHETARASAITGAELYFLDLPEFGFSKTKEETFGIWGYDNALERMVRKIRELRPDVIITNHGPTGGHGHHQAIGQALLDAFDVAGDPEAFPEHLEQGLEPWQPARLFQRSFRSEAHYRIDFNQLDPVRGYSYAEIAAQALREHKTQGMGFFIDRFLTSRSRANYGLVKSIESGTQNGGALPAPGGTLFEGLHDRVSKEARELSDQGDAAAGLEQALALVRATQDEGGDAWRRANALAVALAELKLTAKIDDKEVTPGQEVAISVEAIDFGEKDVKHARFALQAASWFPADTSEPVEQSFSPDGFATARFTARVSDTQPQTIPADEYVFSPHFQKPQLTVAATTEIGGTSLQLEAPVLVDVAPSVTIEFMNAPYLVRRGKDESATVPILVTNHAPDARSVTIEFAGSGGVVPDVRTIAVDLEAEGDQKVITVDMEVSDSIRTGDYTIVARIGTAGYARTALARVVDVDVPENKRVGVILSYDDTFMTTLDRLNVPHEALEIQDFKPERLDEFTTIIVDIRAYLVRQDLVANNQTLLDYVKRGGTLIVMYQKTFEWNEDYAPYALRVGRGRVTVETAPIDILQPDHPLFTTPNKVTREDWDGWRQERGLYFPSRWADDYTPLIAVADPGESPPPGSCLIADYGEGVYMYTALGWYRQLRELHPGTLRIFANMLAL